MNFLKAALLFFFILITFTFFGQEQEFDSLQTNTSPSRWDMIKYDGKSTLGGITHVYTNPLRWKSKDWITFAGIVTGSALLLTVDEPANKFFSDQEEDISKIIKETGFRFGKPLINYGLTTGVYAVGILTKNEKIRKTGVLLIASATAGGIIQTMSKTLAGRARPSTGKGPTSFRFYSSDAGFHSFPSGHSILSFTTAYAVSKQFENPYIKGSIYALGLISPVSRLWAGAHWLTDVVLGVAISVVVVDGIDNYLNTNKRYAYKNERLGIRWNITLGPGQLGLIGSF
ncbi:phosphatase PAP2 family protein [Aquimarina sp. W85]|uniref:phosphatase PAP2 family protein n=1 Tax=Aquimarina rhodophyticola TaxID=3342246 RepID=UPI00366FD29B